MRRRCGASLIPSGWGGLIPLGARTTIIGLPDGGLLLHAPARLSDADHAEIAELGEVRGLVAPNLEHCSWIADAAQRYPDAQLWVAPGVQRRLPAERRHHVLGQDDTVPVWEGVLDALAIDGMPRLQETVFLHPDTGTLITCDLSFNIHDVRSWVDRMALQVAGAYGKFGPSHLFKLYFLQDRVAFKRSLDALLEREFEQVILSHGEPVRSGGRENLREAFAFLG